MTDEVKEYAEKRIWESGIRRVTAHYPQFESREQVDEWIDTASRSLHEEFEIIVFPSVHSIDMKQYKDLLWCLKKNEDNVDIEVLKTRYKTGYDALREQIKTMTNKMIKEVALEGVLIKREDADEQIRWINSAIEESGLLNQIGKAVFQEKDINLVKSLILELKEVIRKAVEVSDNSGAKIDRRVLEEALNLLQGNINRMCVTEDEKELESMYQWAKRRIDTIYEYNKRKLERRMQWAK
ncbi:MAG: hypothetical protein Q4E24_16095 [bacterium]|nr:hypothetical protein [bacterium]